MTSLGEGSRATGQPNREEIKDVFARFSRAYESGDLSLARDLFLDNATANFSNHGDFAGAEAIISGLSRGGSRPDVVRHYPTNEYVATKDGEGQQSSYLTGLLADEVGGKLIPTWFGGHYANAYRLTEGGWKIAQLRFELDWQHGNHPDIGSWPEPRTSLGWSPHTPLPKTISGLDAPWHVVPRPEEAGSDEQQVIDTFTRYTWAVDQWDISLLRDICTDDISIDIVPFGKVSGRREFMSTLQLFRTGRTYLHHSVGDYRIEVGGNKATLQIYRMIPYGITRETLDRDVYGAQYGCSLRKEQGVWKFDAISYAEGQLFELL